MTKFRKNIANHLSTIIGYIVAISEAYITIDWVNFDIKKEWPKLLCAAAIAVGGHMTSINKLKIKE